MGIKDLLRAPGALAEIREAENRIAEHREAIGYTERIIAHSLAVAQGTYSPDAAQCAAVEFASGIGGARPGGCGRATGACRKSADAARPNGHRAQARSHGKLRELD